MCFYDEIFQISFEMSQIYKSPEFFHVPVRRSCKTNPFYTSTAEPASSYNLVPDGSVLINLSREKGVHVQVAIK